jgi:NADPH2:quinone reductase
MRAVLINQFGSFKDAILEETLDPLPKAGEVLVEIYATAVNYVDLLLIAGKHQSRPATPYIPGKGPAGIVSSIGDGVTDLTPGDRVIAMCEPGGGYAEKIALPATQCHKIPDTLTFSEAAGMALVFDTAWFALRERARMQKGETVLILGASGGVGLAAIELVKALGGRALAGISSRNKERLVLEAGADEVIWLDNENIHDDLRKQVFAATNHNGADIIIDPLGDRFLGAGLRALAWCGRLVIIGFAAGLIPSIKANYLLVKNIEVSGLQIGDYRKRTPNKTAQCFNEIFALYQNGKIKPLPVEVLPIEQFQDALERVERREVQGRIVLEQLR